MPGPRALIRGRAPLRVSFCGGGTDVDPYPADRGGCVLSATIDKYAYASLAGREDQELNIRSLDYDVVAKYKVNTALVYDGELDLVKAVVRAAGTLPGGLDLFLHADAPPGSGLGSSSTMVVATLGALWRWLGREHSPYELAEQAYRIERGDLGIRGGQQDQYAAVFGGFNFMEFTAEGVVVHPLRLEPNLINELHYRLLLVYTGRRRLSARIIERQVDGYLQGSPQVVSALDALKALTLAMKNALLQERLDTFAALLHEAWEAKKGLAPGVTDEAIDELYAVARGLGASGGKILGAGGGGYLLLCCPFRSRPDIACGLEQLGGQVVPFAFSPKGLECWTVRSGSQ